MTKFYYLLAAALLFASCRKEQGMPIPKPTPDPGMSYIELNNVKAGYQQTRKVDIDGDGQLDFWFSAELIGDPILERDYLRFHAFSTINAKLLNNSDDQSPVLNQQEVIGAKHQGYTWWDISAIALVDKVTTVYNGVFWQGLGKNANHQFLPIAIKRNNQHYYGWVELSFSLSEEKLILHRAAICKVADTPVRAGL